VKPAAKIAFNECALTGIVFDGRFSPLRLYIEDDKVVMDLSNRNKSQAIFIDPDIRLLNEIIANKRKLPKAFKGKLPQDFKAQIIALYTKKTYEGLSFMLKAKQAVIGRRAIDRALLGHTEKEPLAVLQTPEGSEAICNNFKFKQQSLRVIKDFSQEMLQKVSGREKISYYCILNTEMGNIFVNDYMKYLKIIAQ
jgi:predicted RNA-binding protein YlxR (DUF448 family)